MGICLGGSEVKLGNGLKGNGPRPLGVQGSDLGRVGNLWVRNLLRRPQQQNQRPQNQRQKAQAQSRAPSPVQEEESYEVLLAAFEWAHPGVHFWSRFEVVCPSQKSL